MRVEGENSKKKKKKPHPNTPQHTLVGTNLFIIPQLQEKDCYWTEILEKNVCFPLLLA
jgi:hypothetical protein